MLVVEVGDLDIGYKLEELPGSEDVYFLEDKLQLGEQSQIINSSNLDHLILCTTSSSFIMLSSVLSLALGASMANALALRGDGCQVHLSVDGAVKGPVGEISSGQVRAGSGIKSSELTFKDGGFTDSWGWGCWWTRKYIMNLII